MPDDGPAQLYETGKPLPRQFFIVHGIQLSHDGLLYVSDRQRARIQVLRRDGTFVREVASGRDGSIHISDGRAPQRFRPVR